MTNDRFTNAGFYEDVITGVSVRLTWDERDKCWRLWKARHGRFERVPGESLGDDYSDRGVNSVVAKTVHAFETLVKRALAE